MVIELVPGWVGHESVMDAGEDWTVALNCTAALCELVWALKRTLKNTPVKSSTSRNMAGSVCWTSTRP
jgi:hypothetical protein